MNATRKQNSHQYREPAPQAPVQRQPKPAKVKWPDLSPHGLRLVVSVLPDQHRLLVLVGGDKVPESAKRLGFRRLDRSAQWVRDELQIKLNTLQREFPRLRVVEMEPNEIVRLARIRPGSGTETTEMPAEASLMQATMLGMNYLGDAVWEGAAGRFVRRGNETIKEFDTRLPGPAAVLRQAGGTDLARCADGFVNEILSGKHLQSRDLIRFASAINGEPIDVSDPRLRQAQEAVEAALVRRIAADGSALDRGTFDLALRLYEGQPIFKARTSSSVVLQQFSTPLPMSVVGQRLLGTADDLRGKTILEPTIGNAALVALLTESSIIGRDLDENRLDNAARMLLGTSLDRANPNSKDAVNPNRTVDLSRADAAVGRYPACDYSILNPPFGGLPSPVAMQGLRVSRIDHLILMKSLDARDPNGRTVAIIGGDSPQRAEPGQVVGGSRYLFNWLADHYNVEGVVEADGSLFSRQGASYPIRFVVVGAKKETPDKGLGPTVIPNQLEVVRDYDELWDWSSRILSKRAEAEVVADEVVETPPPANSEQVQNQGEENTWQAPYSPQSLVGEATAMIPRNLVAPTRAALTKIAAEHGDVDEWVASELGWTIEELTARLAPEQVDAVALDFYAVDHGRALIEADQTGLGKGRVLACAARRAALKGLPVVFMTEKPNLFSDFCRDLQDIDSMDLFNPMILNAGVPVRDTVSGQILIPATPGPQVRAALENGELVPGTNLVLCTYSQFARAGAKADWLRGVSRGSRLILDESHNAAGDSFTAEVISTAVEEAAEVIHSSATYAKGAKNLTAYKRAFPPGMELKNLAENLQAGGEVLQEVLSAMLAEDGVLIRREHDLSRVEFQVVLDEKRSQRNRDLCDALAPILAGMAYLGGDVSRLVAQMNKENKKALEQVPEEDRKGARMHVSSMEFGSRLYSINRLFVMALEMDLAKEVALERLKQGEKPVFFVENTMESLLRDIVNDMRLEDGEAPLDDLPADFGINLQFRDLLGRTLGRLMTITEKDGYGSYAKRKVTDEDTVNAFERIRAMIEQFPDLPVSPIDEIRESLEVEGFTASELTGRSLQVVDGQAVPRPAEDRNTIISRFNGGHLDALTISGAGSTGLSLHSGARFPDQRRRCLIELQIANNVNQRVQTWGRVNRKDQVNTPAILTLNTGLPAQARLMAMQNEKLRKLSANVTSNRSSAAEDQTVPDILNWVGDLVCKRMLYGRPDLADKLCIELPSEKEAPDHEDCWYVNKLLGRLTLLPSTEQEDLYQEIAVEFRAVMEDFEARGTNPFKAREMDGTWEVTNRFVFDGAEAAARRTVFDAPIYWSVIEGERLIKPIRSDQVEEQVRRGRERLANASGVDADEAVWRVIGVIDKRRPELLAAVLPKGFATVKDALKADKDNAVKERAQYLEKVTQSLEQLQVGGAIWASDEEGEKRKGVVLRLDLPPVGKEHAAGQLAVTFAFPGDEAPRRMSLFALMRDEHFWGDPQGSDLKAFDIPPEGAVRTTRAVLDGNLFRALEQRDADGSRAGRVVVFRDKEGVAHRAVLLPKDHSPPELMPVMMKAGQAADFLVQGGKGVSLSTVPTFESDDGITINVAKGQIVLAAPGGSGSAALYASPTLTKVTGEWAGDRNRMYARVPMEKAHDLMAAMAEAGHRLYAMGEFRQWANDWVAENASRDIPTQQRLEQGKRR